MTAQWAVRADPDRARRREFGVLLPAFLRENGSEQPPVTVRAGKIQGGLHEGRHEAQDADLIRRQAEIQSEGLRSRHRLYPEGTGGSIQAQVRRNRDLSGRRHPRRIERFLSEESDNGN